MSDEKLICNYRIIPMNWELVYDKEISCFMFSIRIKRQYHCSFELSKFKFAFIMETCKFKTQCIKDVDEMSEKLYKAIIQWPSGKLERYITNRSMRLLGLRSDDESIANLCKTLDEREVFNNEVIVIEHNLVDLQMLSLNIYDTMSESHSSVHPKLGSNPYVCPDCPRALGHPNLI